MQGSTHNSTSNTTHTNNSSWSPVKTLNVQLEVVGTRLERRHQQFKDAGVAFEDRVRQLDEVALRLDEIKTRVLRMGLIPRLAQRNTEMAAVKAIGECIDRIVQA